MKRNLCHTQILIQGSCQKLPNYRSKLRIMPVQEKTDFWNMQSLMEGCVKPIGFNWYAYFCLEILKQKYFSKYCVWFIVIEFFLFQILVLQASVGTPTKKIDIFLTMCPPGEREYPITVIVVASAKIHDLIGLICWQYTNEGREPKLKWG